MYQFSGKLKILSIALMLVGALGVWHSFYTAPETVEEATEMLSHNKDAHGNSHGETKEVHADESQENKEHAEKSHDGEIKEGKHGASADHDKEHAEHAFHQLQNRPWAALYVALFFFLGITLLVLAFYASQRVAHSGWSVVLFRVMEAITANLIPTSIIMVLVIVAAAMHWHHLFPWMAEGTFDPQSPNYDAIVDGKKWWLNVPGWVIRGIVYLAIWNAYRWFIRRNSIAEDTAKDRKIYKRNYNVSVVFLVLFMFTESMMSWDWVMGLDPHWFSTVFGWYVLASLLVSAITVIAFVTIYLRAKGHLPLVNDSHIHDLA